MAQKILKVFLGLLAIGCVVISVSSESSSYERSLIRKQLLQYYDKYEHPDNLTVKFGIALVRFDAFPDLNKLETIGWLRYAWTDPRLKYDAETGVDVLHLQPDQIWKPDITLYNSYLPDGTKCTQTNVLVYPKGEVLWVPPCSFKVHCDMKELRKDPEGKQKCFLKFGSWTYDGWKLGMKMYNDQHEMDMSDYAWDNKWKITENNAVLNNKTYPCCSEPYLDITYNLGFQTTAEKRELLIRNDDFA
jgi:nicotinic acetylcholine receptor